MTFEANTNVELVKGIQETHNAFANQMEFIDGMLYGMRNQNRSSGSFRGFRRLCEHNKVEYTGTSLSNAEAKFVVNFAPEGYYNPKREKGVVNEVFEYATLSNFTVYGGVSFDILPEFFQLVVYVPLRDIVWADSVVSHILRNIHAQFTEDTRKGTLQKKGYKEILGKLADMRK